MALDHTLVTDNDEEFARIQGLRVENWLRDK
jgi:tRNA(fMet)-specific endonuclease VapC